MRRFSIVFLGIVLVAAVIADQTAWDSFKQKYGKKYKNAVEERARKKIFMDNCKKVDTHNELYKNGTISHEKGINKFSDWSDEEFHSVYNHVRDRHPHDEDTGDDHGGHDDDYVDIADSAEAPYLKEIRKHTKMFRMPDDAEIPASIDWREKGAVTSVKNQCGGSCGLYAPIGSTEGQYFRKTGKLVSLSAQNFMDCLDEKQKTCYGVLPEDAYAYMRMNGIDSEDSYQCKEDICECTFDPTNSVTKIKSMVKIRHGDERALTYALATVGPIGIEFNFDGLKDHKRGTYYRPHCPDHYNHAALIVGYGSDDDGDYYIIKNQWGSDWGEGGYFKMARNRGNNCGVASHGTFPRL